MNDRKEKQLQIDEAVKEARTEFESMFKNSGKSRVVFMMSTEAVQFLGVYQAIREAAEGQGFIMPPLLESVDVSLSDETEE